MGLRSLTPMILAALMLMMSWGALIDAVEMNNEDENTAVLDTVDVVFAPSNPGHTVFAQYITSVISFDNEMIVDESRLNRIKMK